MQYKIVVARLLASSSMSKATSQVLGHRLIVIPIRPTRRELPLHPAVRDPIRIVDGQLSRRRQSRLRRQHACQSLLQGRRLDGAQVDRHVFADAPFEGGDGDGALGAHVDDVGDEGLDAAGRVGDLLDLPRAVELLEEGAVDALEADLLGVEGRQVLFRHVHGDGGGEVEADDLLRALLVKAAFVAAVAGHRAGWRPCGAGDLTLNEVGNVDGEAVVVGQDGPDVLQRGVVDDDLAADASRVGGRALDAHLHHLLRGVAGDGGADFLASQEPCLQCRW
mmetsp:Transcript_14785/g.40904  ORF Transcript_14785/g.40904 Transcript_14785/m.40904 type:complete len:278 (+) Transcript_14785:1071-1904(+)